MPGVSSAHAYAPPVTSHPFNDGSESTPPRPPKAGDSAWREDELAGNVHQRGDKPEKVRRMFAAIAGSYDLNNRLHSFWQDQRWRRVAVKVAGVRPSDEVLDVACGTGDLTRAFAKARPKRVLGVDFTTEMLDVARARRARDEQSGSSPALITSYAEGDATKLAFADGSFDVLSIAFGIRNVGEPARALAEFYRVLRPGGRLVILEFDKPGFAPIRVMSEFYTNRIMPITATLISRDRSGAYKYLPRSVSTFLDRSQLAQGVRTAGFVEVQQWPLSFGVCVCTRGVKPARS
jgi:demethylmenaquinone methyltransferase/2-methoxy-6-polyprenyl-1,4-benzoquinol methylase